MRRRTIIIIASVTGAVIVASGLGVLIWWLVTRGEDAPPYDETTLPDVTTPEIDVTPLPEDETTLSDADTTTTDDITTTDGDGDDDVDPVVVLEGEGFGTTPFTAAFTKLHDVGDVFWWFYPSIATRSQTRPLIVWLDGETGVPPSLLANLGMIGPYDFNFNVRSHSWINHGNLLFIDAPVGTGYSTPLDDSTIPKTVEENVKHLVRVLKSFYVIHEEYISAPLFIFGQGDGARAAVALAIELDHLKETSSYPINIQGIALGNSIISPALAMTKLGLYLEELGYIDGQDRVAVESLSQVTNILVNDGALGTAFDSFVSLGRFVNQYTSATAVNLLHIVEKLTREPLGDPREDYFGHRNYMRSILHTDAFDFMNDVVSPALGISPEVRFDAHRADVIAAVRDSYMIPVTDKIEYILEYTDLTVSIYNGNLDAVSNTPGQLEWVNNLEWSGQTQFRNSNRQTLAVNGLIEGYYRETDRLKFFWINVAGQSTPLDNPDAMNAILPRITIS